MFRIEILEGEKKKTRSLEEIRQLWKLIFSEDSDEFLEYYFHDIAQNNTILVAKEADKETLIGMLHLNPYRVTVNGQNQLLYYVVAVATHPEYRKQGVMRSLLSRAKVYAQEKNAYALILQPEDERYYRPFGYQFVNQQLNTTIDTTKYIVENKLNVPNEVIQNSFQTLEIEDFIDKFSDFVSLLKKGKNHRNEIIRGVVEVVLSLEYGKRLYHEVTADKGMVLYRNNAFVFCYLNSSQVEIRKVIFPPMNEDEREELLKQLIEFAYPRKLILHETNERTVTEKLPYYRGNFYDVRKYMMVLPIQAVMAEKWMFDEVV
ncbi:MAG: GNAT family N-acetyltransferase [Vallitaleaceae bacterium]|nr:GNAT family N-acetyltransferase [Vallitaleaceae bacterium]